MISLTTDELESLEGSARRIGIALSTRAVAAVVTVAQLLLAPFTGLSGLHFALMITAVLALASSAVAVFWFRRNVWILKNLITTRKPDGV